MEGLAEQKSNEDGSSEDGNHIVMDIPDVDPPTKEVETDEDGNDYVLMKPCTDFQNASQVRDTRCCRCPSVGLVVLCVFLLASNIGLGVQYLLEKISPMQEKESQCPTSWKQFQRKCYHVSCAKSWTEARKDCKAAGADLVIIKSREVQEFIAGLKTNGWIGLQGHGTGWMWVDNSPLNTTGYWSPGQPSNQTQSCVMSRPDSYNHTLSWQDNPCECSWPSFCEKSSD